MEIMTDGRLITSGGDGQLKVWNIVGENGDNINLKTGEEGKKEDSKSVESYKNVGKITYANKDDVKHHDLAKIEKNINQHRDNMNKNNNKK